MVQFAIILVVPCISFSIFHHHLNHTMTYKKQLLKNSINTQAYFLNKPVVKNHTLIGELSINHQRYKYYYYLKNDAQSTYYNQLYGYSCNIKGNFKTVDEHLNSNLYVNLESINSCRVHHSTISNLIERHKQFVLTRLNERHVRTPGKIIALITGDTSMIDETDLEKVREIGIYHLLAISGTHIGAIIGLIYYILNRFQFPLALIKLILFILLPVYTLYTDLAPSAIRAVSIALLIILLPKQIYKQSIHLLALVFMISTLINPAYIYNIGFQFSYLITFFILFSLPVFENASTVKCTLYITVIAQIGSFIISAIYFNQIQWIGVLSNLFFVPFYACCLLPLALFYFLTLHFPFEIIPLTKILNFVTWIHDVTVNLFMKLATIKWIIPELSSIFITITVLLLVLTVILLVHKQYLSFSVVMIIVLIITTILPKSNDYKLTMLNVGQGDALLFETSQRESVLIDTGGALQKPGEHPNHMLAKKRIMPTLKKHGVKKIKYLIITHPHVDHMGELNYLINTIKIENLIINQHSFEKNLLKGLIKQCNDNEIKVLDFKKVPQFSINAAKFKLLDTTISSSDDLNEHSIVTFIECNGIKILLMGDATIHNESELLRKYNIGKVDILKVGHHGSKTSTSNAFINNIKPRISLISVAKKNRYNLPSIEVIKRLQNAYSKIYMTSQSGEITISLKTHLLINGQPQ
ncbi:DNA internalization-related competence protein ComEC/Rec2 [Staphylococcus caeli]|uniref:DNA internalization-related competence protein ComEC/Rec2 n=1 Tax=Staphylococcus caeli TaxID=2201815 RepID=UPI003F55EA5D